LYSRINTKDKLNATQKENRGKVYFTPQPMMVGTHHPQPMKMDFLPSELSKTGQSTP
jgi:hypothetical protein